MKTYAIALLPGDGVGPEVTAVARDVLREVGDRFRHRFEFRTELIGGAAIDTFGDPLPPQTLEACRSADAVFLGAVGGPKWDGAPPRPEQGLLGLRKALGLFANVRPTRVYSDLIDRSPLRREIVEDVDLVIFRELTGGAYFGERKRGPTFASDECLYTTGEIERIGHAAFAAARARRGKVTSVDKANVLETSRLWREVITKLHERHYRDVQLEHALVDSMAMQLIRQPRAYDVILTENMFGDILSDEASVLGGSIGLSPSASLGATGPGLFEPVHGSAPDIAGKDRCNPIGGILSAALLLRYGLRLHHEADAVEVAVEAVIRSGERTADLGGQLGCRAMGEAIIDELHSADLPRAHHVQMHWG
ncbi:MAG TPA: 3-isopropylmalate dehydrogenase [Vitreimonas sp.]|uniref:3-isopropylmalate dehydrogenase n=1 Tax=Vitreimonas sp. TaxID=3069702 RepID=UPI002D2EEB50|nr:3-isopropylmalate dehydrogenase [Vitreimonas sp.]HYD88099.1 3-isopropylmalate dehydrogenase [Vitreimonas sp.]